MVATTVSYSGGTDLRNHAAVPKALQKNCLLALDSTRVFSVGGTNYAESMFYTDVYYYDLIK